MNSGIYKITNKINGKYYIGRSINIQNRWDKHIYQLKSGNHVNYKLQNDCNNAGGDIDKIFKFEILETVLEYEDDIKDIKSPEELKELDEILTKKEQGYIDLSTIFGMESIYNINMNADGSQLGMKHSDETKKKMSDARKGMKRSDESKKKMSDAHKGMKHSDESKKKMSEWKRSDETKKKMSEWKRSDESKKKMSDAHKDQTIYTFKNINTNVIEQMTQYDLRMKYGLNGGNVCSLVRGKIKSVKGWILREKIAVGVSHMRTL